MKRREFIASLFSLPFVVTGIYVEEKKQDTFYVLTPKRARTLKALGEAYFTPGVGKNINGDELVRNIDKFMLSYNSDIRKGFLLMLAFVEILPILLFYSIRTFSALSIEERKKFLEKLHTSRFKFVRTILFAVKSIPCMYYFSDPEVKRRIGITYKV